MRILFLDDDARRTVRFKRSTINHDVHCVETANEAIDALNSKEFELVFLDHDLGGEIYVKSGPGTGYQVAQHIAEMPTNRTFTVITHSLNENGAKNIEYLLKQVNVDVHRVPFTSDLFWKTLQSL